MGADGRLYLVAQGAPVGRQSREAQRGGSGDGTPGRNPGQPECPDRALAGRQPGHFATSRTHGSGRRGAVCPGPGHGGCPRLPVADTGRERARPYHP